jgi:hypothetical protein
LITNRTCTIITEYFLASSIPAEEVSIKIKHWSNSRTDKTSTSLQLELDRIERDKRLHAYIASIALYSVLQKKPAGRNIEL